MNFISKLTKKQEPVKTLTDEEILEILIKKYNQYCLTIENYTEIIEKIRSACMECGGTIRSIKLVHDGQDALVFECEGEIIKLITLNYGTNKLSNHIANCDAILRLNTEYCLDLKGKNQNVKMTILTEKKLSKENITQADVYDVYFKLREDGYIWNNPRKENLGRNEYGKVLLFDYGQLIYINSLDPHQKEYELNKHREMFPTLDEAYEQFKEYQEENDIKIK